MGFNSFEFFLFLPIMFFLYWRFGRSGKSQNVILLIGSYVFYGLWDWRFLFLIGISSGVDYILGYQIAKKPKKGTQAKRLLYLSIAVNVGLLGFFKYFNFFIGSFANLIEALGLQANIHTLKIILPVGISFYTFQTLSYTIDIYRGRLKPTNDWVKFFTFVSFFPQLVAGPIERATRLLAQFDDKRKFDYPQAVHGMRFILYGLFKKIVIADNLAEQVDVIFSNYTTFGGSDLLLGAAVLFVPQLYADFSAYSDIAIGTALLFGVQLSRNFAYPLFSKNFEEFWQRWHITLTTWFRDYFFVPLRRSSFKKLGDSAILVMTFTVIGLWHGANYTFLLWGFVNGLFFLVYNWLKKKGLIVVFNRKSELVHIPHIALTTVFISLSCILFRSDSVGMACDYLVHMFRPSLFSIPEKWAYCFWPAVLYIWEWQFRDHWHGLAIDGWPKHLRWGTYFVFTLLIMYYFGAERDFIYFQF